MSPPIRAADGAWGIRLPQYGHLSGLLSLAPQSWPEVHVTVRVDDDPAQDTMWDEEQASFLLLGGHRLEVRRHPARASLTLLRETPEEGVVQPHLSGAAITLGAWLGRQVLHGGAFVHAGGAWLLLGDKEMGKSTTLGHLAERGIEVLTDDLIVYEAGAIFAGPRCVDLRPQAAGAFPTARGLGLVGTRERWRLDLPAVSAPTTPLHGMVFLAWGPGDTTMLDPIERLRRIPPHRAIHLPWEDPTALLELADRPAFVWQREHDVEKVDRGLDALLEAIDLTVQAGH